MNTQLIALAKANGATDYTPAPLRAVRGVSFTYQALEAFALDLMGAADVTSAWRAINTMDLTDELVWLRKGNVVEGPRPAETDDYDRWTEWAPCDAPPRFERATAGPAQADRADAEDGAFYGWPNEIIGHVLNTQEDVVRLRDFAAGRPRPGPWAELTDAEYLTRLADSFEVAATRASEFLHDNEFPRGAVAGYVIERAKGGRWRTIDTLGMPEWTANYDDALCFSQRKHADAFAADDSEDVRIKPRNVPAVSTEGTVAWGLFAWVNDAWALQFPVRATAADCIKDTGMYTSEQRLEVAPLFARESSTQVDVITAARSVGLREAMHGVDPTTASRLLEAFLKECRSAAANDGTMIGLPVKEMRA